MSIATQTNVPKALHRLHRVAYGGLQRTLQFSDLADRGVPPLPTALLGVSGRGLTILARLCAAGGLWLGAL
eukprot:1185300-Prorocentrum_minimum.AAC.1